MVTIATTSTAYPWQGVPEIAVSPDNMEGVVDVMGMGNELEDTLPLTMVDMFTLDTFGQLLFEHWKTGRVCFPCLPRTKNVTTYQTQYNISYVERCMIRPLSMEARTRPE